MEVLILSGIAFLSVLIIALKAIIKKLIKTLNEIEEIENEIK